MSILKSKGIVPQNSEDEAITIFEQLIKDDEGNVIPFTDVDCTNMAEYVRTYWKAYKDFSSTYLANKLEQKRQIAKQEGRDPNKETTNANTFNGAIFEYIIATLLYKKGITPFYTQAKVAFVPNVIYDIILYTTEANIICLTLKTSFRERIKQADLEAVALRYVHRRAKTFLLTLSSKEANTQKKNLTKGGFLGLTTIVDCNKQEDLDNLIENLSLCKYRVSETIDTVCGHLVGTKE